MSLENGVRIILDTDPWPEGPFVSKGSLEAALKAMENGWRFVRFIAYPPKAWKQKSVCLSPIGMPPGGKWFECVRTWEKT